MIRYFETVSDVKKILSGQNKEELIVILIARHSDGKKIFSKIDEQSLNDLCGNKILFGITKRAEINKKIKSVKKASYNNALITDIIDELKITENKVPSLYLYNTLEKSYTTIHIDNNTDVYSILKKIIINFNKYILNNKKTKVYANGMELMVASLEKKENPVFTFILKKNNFIKMITVVTSLYTCFSIISNKLYKIKCESFYNIPSKYFSVDYSIKIILLVCLLLMFSVPLMCLYGKRYIIKSGATKFEVKSYTLIVTIFAGLCMGLLNIYDLIFITETPEKIFKLTEAGSKFINRHSNGIVWTTMILGMLSVVGVILFDDIWKIKKKSFRAAIQWISLIPILFTTILFSAGIYFKMSSGVEELRKYEIICDNNNQYVVLSNCDDKALVAQFNVDENGQYVFYTSEYQFIDKYKGDFKYIVLNYKPIIE